MSGSSSWERALPLGLRTVFVSFQHRSFHPVCTGTCDPVCGSAPQGPRFAPRGLAGLCVPPSGSSSGPHPRLSVPLGDAAASVRCACPAEPSLLRPLRLLVGCFQRLQFILEATTSFSAGLSHSLTSELVLLKSDCHQVGGGWEAILTFPSEQEHYLLQADPLGHGLDRLVLPTASLPTSLARTRRLPPVTVTQRREILTLLTTVPIPVCSVKALLIF